MQEVTIKRTIANGEKAETSQSMGYLIYFLFGLLEVLLIFRLIFKVSGANPLSNFVSFIYILTQMFILPFAGIFHQTTTQGIEATAILEPATVTAIIVYPLVAWGLMQFIAIISRNKQ